MQGLLSSERLGNSSLWGASSSNIKSIQRGTSTISASNPSVNTAITSIDTTKSIIRITTKSSSIFGASYDICKAVITSSTQLTFTRNTSNTNSITIYWEVIEFNNVKSLQSGQSGFAVTTVTVSAVNTSKSLLFSSGINNTTNTTADYYNFGSYLIDSTTIGLNYPPGGLAIYWYLIEFN